MTGVAVATWSVHTGDCLEFLRTLPAGSVDAVVTDPPYAEINRDYGRFTEDQWHELMNAVVVQVRRLLVPTGSAMFVLQPNSERVGRMRSWLWKFMAKWTDEWNMIQDVWWWNFAAAPTIHCQRGRGLMRPSMKACVWLGPESAYRNQEAVLWAVSDSMTGVDVEDRVFHRSPSGQSVRAGRIKATCVERGGSTPMNVWPLSNGGSVDSGGSHGHGAATPYELCARMVRYLCPDGGTVLDPFTGSGTTGIAAINNQRNFVGCERDSRYADIARRRIADAAPLFGAVAESKTVERQGLLIGEGTQ